MTIFCLVIPKRRRLVRRHLLLIRSIDEVGRTQMTMQKWPFVHPENRTRPYPNFGSPPTVARGPDAGPGGTTWRQGANDLGPRARPRHTCASSLSRAPRRAPIP